MSKLNKLFLIILIFQYSKASPCFDYSDFQSYEFTVSDFDEADNNVCGLFPQQGCPEGQSLISSNDLMVLVNYIVKRSHIVEDIFDTYHDKFVTLTNKHLNELNEFQESAEGKTEHIKHILESINDLHKKLEPIGQGIAAEIDKIDVSEDHVSAVDNNLERLLKKFQMFQELCKINGKHQEPVNQLKRNHVFKSSEDNIKFKPICENIEVIYAEAMKKIHQFRDETMRGLDGYEPQLDEDYKNAVISYNDRLTDGALKQYNSLMYDILKLQDGYFHLNLYFSNFNLSSQLDTIENNMQKVESLLVEMEKNVDEYGTTCVNSHTQVRIRLGGAIFRSFKVDSPEVQLTSSDIIDAVMSIKFQEIEGILQNKLIGVFKELNERLNDPRVIKSYIQKLAPKEEDMDNVEKAIERMNELKKLIPQSTFKKLQDLYNKSEQVLQKAEKAKEDIEAKIKLG